MTLQEAKEWASKKTELSDWEDSLCNYMYDAGREEGRKDSCFEKTSKLIHFCMEECRKLEQIIETQRIALETIAKDEYPAYYAEALSAELWSLKSIAHKALNNETQDS